MTDHFEVRLSTVMRRDAETAVRPIDAVAIAGKAMRRPVSRNWRSPVVRGLGVAVLAGATIAGGLLLAGRMDEDPTRTPPASSGPQTFAPQVQAIVGADGRLNGATVWAADVEPILAIGHPGGRLRFVSGYGGLTTGLRTLDDRLLLASDLDLSAPADELRLSLIRDDAGCRVGDIGTYRLSATGDGMRVAVQAVEDPCAARATALARTWYRTFHFDSDGGPGLIDVFDPTLRIALPAGDWAGSTFPNWFSVGRRDAPGGFDVARNPQGLTDPCAENGGEPVAIEPGVSAFAAYLDDLPGVSVESTPLTVAGYPASLVVATSTRTQACPAERSMVAWRLDTLPVHKLSGGLDGSDELYVVEVGDATLVFTVVEASRELLLEDLQVQTSLEIEAPP